MKLFQPSESLTVGFLLALTGGLLDAYSYLNRGEVFATAETGNIVLMGINLAQQNWSGALHYLLPVLAFTAGILAAEWVRRRCDPGEGRPQRLHWRLPLLLAECVAILVVSALPVGPLDPLANIIISFASALQVESFRNIQGYGCVNFGGEPLMAMDTVKEAVAYARSLEKEHDKVFRFTITTNGMLLNDENIDYINREMSNVVLSLDGRKEVNDHMRPTAGGKGSYDVIVPKFQKLVAGRGTKDYYARGTFTRENLDFAADVMHLADLGFRHVSVEPASGPLDDPFAIKEEDLAKVEEEYEKLARELMGRKDVNFFHFNVDLAQGPCVIKRLRGCGAGCEYVAVTPDGDIFPCHQFVGKEEYRMGNVFDGSFDMDISGKFADQNIYTRPACRECWARFYCSGGCSASNLLVNGDISLSNEVACEMERKRLECAIALKAIAAGMGEVPNTEGNYTNCNQCEDCQKAE